MSVLLSAMPEASWPTVIALLALGVSWYSVAKNIEFSRKTVQVYRSTLRVSMQQAIFKVVSNKAKDVNKIWEQLSPEKQIKSDPHCDLMSEIVITKEILEEAFELFKAHDDDVITEKGHFYYLFYKQLRTDLRGWLENVTTLDEYATNTYYRDQVNDVFEKLQPFFLKATRQYPGQIHKAKGQVT